jgi:hypothetical protein
VKAPPQRNPSSPCPNLSGTIMAREPIALSLANAVADQVGCGFLFNQLPLFRCPEANRHRIAGRSLHCVFLRIQQSFSELLIARIARAASRCPAAQPARRREP